MPTKIKQISVEGEKFYFSFSFDIDDFVGDGIWWLQIYDNHRNLIYDKPFNSSTGILERRKVREIIKGYSCAYNNSSSRRKLVWID